MPDLDANTKYCEARQNFPEADFWLIRQGQHVGKPTKTFAPDHIGVKVTTDRLIPNFVFYLIELQYQNGKFEGVKTLQPDFFNSVGFIFKDTKWDQSR